MNDATRTNDALYGEQEEGCWVAFPHNHQAGDTSFGPFATRSEAAEFIKDRPHLYAVNTRSVFYPNGVEMSEIDGKPVQDVEVGEPGLHRMEDRYPGVFVELRFRHGNVTSVVVLSKQQASDLGARLSAYV